MNELQIAFNIKVKAVRDSRYRVLVTLMRSDRPRYWNFNCNNCGSKVCELQNVEVIGLDDFYNPEAYAGTVKHCKGQLNGQPCPYSYFFVIQ